MASVAGTALNHHPLTPYTHAAGCPQLKGIFPKDIPFLLLLVIFRGYFSEVMIH